MEKILEKKIDWPVPRLQKKIDQHLTKLKKKYGRKEYKVAYRWDRSKRKLLMKSRYFTGEIDLHPGGISAWVDLPFLFRLFKGRIVAEVSKEIDEIVRV